MIMTDYLRRLVYFRRRLLFVLICCFLVSLIPTLYWYGFLNMSNSNGYSLDRLKSVSPGLSHFLFTKIPFRTSEKRAHLLPVATNSVVLVLKLKNQSQDSALLIEILQALRMAHVHLTPNQFEHIPSMLLSSDPEIGLVNLIIFEDFLLWDTLQENTRGQISDYCKKFDVGMIGFVFNTNVIRESLTYTKLRHYPIILRKSVKPLTGFYLARESPVLKVARGGAFDPRPLTSAESTVPSVPRKCQLSNYSQLLATTRFQSTNDRFATPMVNYSSLLRRMHEDCGFESQPICCEATLIPMPFGPLKFQTIAFTKVDSGINVEDPVLHRSCAGSTRDASENVKDGGTIYQSLVVEDVGEIDGIKRILFSFQPSSHWSTRLLLMDSIRYLTDKTVVNSSPGIKHFDLGLDRWIHVDIDDVFVASHEAQLQKDDVTNLIVWQENLREKIPGFTLNLGFSGSFYGRGNSVGRFGDREFLIQASRFRWFCHTWAHLQAHQLSPEALIEQMNLNKRFATENQLPILDGYAVAPHHSGVYPLVPALYEAWKSVWGVNVTTTEGYPSLFPAWRRRGFAYKGVQVLPRQTSGVYTHTLRFADHPEGRTHFQKLGEGGEVFHSILFNPVSLFMTHYGNYGQDRLGSFVLSKTVDFVRSWTNLRLLSGTPQQLAQVHLRFNGAQESPSSLSAGLPLQSNPCANRRHSEIWPVATPCDDANLLPMAIIGGPQKTGTTALLAFMGMHSNLLSNIVKTNETFEEIQFFSNNEIYENGVGWYLEQFPRKRTRLVALKKYAVQPDRLRRFEKSATYFDSPLAPERIAALLPQVKLIFILRDPLERAYSWYQHQRAHKDSVALHFSFTEVISVTSLDAALLVARKNPKESTTASKLADSLYALHRHCLQPSDYARHLSLWLRYYSPKSILVIDAQQMSSAPASVMDKVQEFLRVDSYLNYSNILQFNQAKKFFCARDGPHPSLGRLLNFDPASKMWCLSASKGRIYPDLESLRLTQSEGTTSAFALLRNAMVDLNQLLLSRPFWRPIASTSATDILPSWLFKWLK